MFDAVCPFSKVIPTYLYCRELYRNQCKEAAQFTGIPARVAMLVQVDAFSAGRLEASALTNPA
jgi:hypothetical protein